jgi:hypothetical protein
MRYHIRSNSIRPVDGWRVGRRLTIRASVRCATAIVLCALASSLLSQRALAQGTVRIDGNVLLYASRGTPVADYYGENPFTTANDGIPTGGNIIEGFRGLPGDFAGSGQVRFEGRIDDMGTPATADDDNINFHIVVGRTSSGQLSILGGADLRDMDLIIGDSGTLNGQTLRGSGTVRIDGEGSLFNNNPFILPFFPGQDPEMPTQPSKSPRADEDDVDDGFDLFVGRSGTGTLQITAGGRAEIQDAVLVGSLSGSVGTLIVDGIDSFLGSGGVEAEATSDDTERHEMIIGRLGTGTMSITNGGTVYAVAPDETSQMEFVVAAVVGSNRPARGNELPELGGQGTVVVDGIASTWLIGGTLQLGGFHNSINDSDSMEDMEGDEAFYPASTGRGTLNIANGGLVSIVSPIPADEEGGPNPDQPVQLDVVLGRFGKLNLNGGRLDIQPATSSSGQNVSVRDINNFRLINDGVVSGHGDISVGQFRNRALGQVRVGAGQTLVIAANGRFDASEMSDQLPLQNYGLIEVIGNSQARAELEFVRTPGTSPDLPDEPVTPFINFRQATVTGNGGRSQGDIVAQHATLRFGSGLENRGNLTITAGDNIVSGDVVNASPAMMGDLGGAIFIGGNHTTVTFEDSVFLLADSQFTLGPNAPLVTALVDFSMAGAASLSFLLGGNEVPGQLSGHISAVGDIALDGILELDPGTFTFAPGDEFQIMQAGNELSGDFTTFVRPCTVALCFVGFPDYDTDRYFIRAFTAAAAVGADFDGSGIVDEVDLAIWRQNLGGSGPIGDANGDGIVDGRDFFIWQMQASGFPGSASVAGAGAGAGAGFGGAVPEPGSLTLLAVGGLLALAWRRRSG